MSQTSNPSDVSPIGDESKWRRDVGELLESIDAGSRGECLTIAGRVKIYRRLLVYVYVQLKSFEIDPRSLSSFSDSMTMWERWDGLQSLQNHAAIRQGIWDILRARGTHIKMNKSVLSLREILVLDEIDIARDVDIILRDPKKVQELTSLCLDDPAPIINLLQILLDRNLISSDTKMLYQTLARLAKMSATYPDSLLLHRVKLTGAHPIGGGGFSDVWRGKLGEQFVALKALRIFFNDTSLDFCHEAVIWRQLRHKNILPLYGVFEGDNTFDRLCLVSPWMEGGNISDFLISHPDSNRVLLLSDVVGGLCYLHSLEPAVVHGDLKGANIFVTQSGTACLGDFGLTRFRDSNENIWPSTTGNATGTARWTAPELLISDISGKNIRANRASDVYSFGCVCLEVFTGKVPYSEIPREAVVVMAIIQKQRPQRPVGDCVGHGLDDATWDLISKCWHADPTQRPTILQVRESFRLREWKSRETHTTTDDFPGVPCASFGQYGFSEDYVSHKNLQLTRNPTMCCNPNNAVPLFRAWGPSQKEHFYTTSWLEMETAMAYLGYRSEGVAAYIFVTQEVSTVPFFRLRHPMAPDHFYCATTSERDKAVAENSYAFEGIAGYVHASQVCGSVPLFRMWREANVDHFYTTSVIERDKFVEDLGYIDEGIEAFVLPAWS
ncbi:kinase-like protein [Rickenella mellea]|uniref:Kinase-like protein n=1 Tax=Rickenella mellea TaxID=50990 RepID=A0A4Y7PL87_9AGAM|nr:kinase-like protein [Rickenella mellea]